MDDGCQITIELPDEISEQIAAQWEPISTKLYEDIERHRHDRNKVAALIEAASDAKLLVAKTIIRNMVQSVALREPDDILLPGPVAGEDSIEVCDLAFKDDKDGALARLAFDHAKIPEDALLM